MKLFIQVLDSTNSVHFSYSAEVIDQMFHAPDSDLVTITGVKTALDYHLFEKSRQRDESKSVEQPWREYFGLSPDACVTTELISELRENGGNPLDSEDWRMLMMATAEYEGGVDLSEGDEKCYL